MQASEMNPKIQSGSVQTRFDQRALDAFLECLALWDRRRSRTTGVRAGVEQCSTPALRLRIESLKEIAVLGNIVAVLGNIVM